MLSVSLEILDEWRPTLIVAIVAAVFIAFILAAGAVTVDPEWKPWKRFVPMGAFLLPLAGVGLSSMAERWWGYQGWIVVPCGLACPVFLAWTFFLAWNGERPADRVLRVSSGILFFLFFSLATPTVTS